MYNVQLNIPDWETLEKSMFLGPRPGHLYISRKRDGDKWAYTYRNTKVPKSHGNHLLYDDEHHSIDIPEEGHRFAYAPEKSYQHAAWIHAVNTLQATGERQSLRDVSGKRELEIGPLEGNVYKFFAFRDGMPRRKSFKGIEELRSWVAKEAHPPAVVLDVLGRPHHTLTPVVAQRSRSAERGGWQTATFNEENPDNPYKGTGKNKYTFRNRESYETWWAEQNQAMLSSRETSAVEVSEKAMEDRPLTSLLEAGMIPAKVVYKQKTGQREEPVWKLDFQAVDLDAREFNTHFINEHWGMITASVSSAIHQYFPKAKQQGKWQEVFDEMSNQSALALLEAAHRYNPSKGFKFSSFARTWIDTRNLEFAKDRIASVRVGGREAALANFEAPEDLDHTTAIAFQRKWWEVQNSKFRDLIGKLDHSSPSGLAVLSQYSEFQKLEGTSYARTQEWVAHHMGSDWVIPIDEPSTYITSMKDRKELLGTNVAVNDEEKQEYQKVWKRLVSRYFEKQKKDGKSDDQKSYYDLAHKIVMKMLPNGDVHSPDHSFVELGDIFRNELEAQFGNPNRPMLTAMQRVNYVQQIFKRELPRMASNDAIRDSLTESPYSIRHRREHTKQIQAAMTKALVALLVDQIRDYILSKSLQLSLFGPQIAFLGKTKSGKPIVYDPKNVPTFDSLKASHKGWTAKDHSDAATAHYKMSHHIRGKIATATGHDPYAYTSLGARAHPMVQEMEHHNRMGDKHYYSMYNATNWLTRSIDPVIAHDLNQAALNKAMQLSLFGPRHIKMGRTNSGKLIYDMPHTLKSFEEHHTAWTPEDHYDAADMHRGRAHDTQKRIWKELGEDATGVDYYAHPMSGIAHYHHFMADAHFVAASAKRHGWLVHEAKYAIQEANHHLARAERVGEVIGKSERTEMLESPK